MSIHVRAIRDDKYLLWTPLLLLQCHPMCKMLALMFICGLLLMFPYHFDLCDLKASESQHPLIPPISSARHQLQSSTAIPSSPSAHSPSPPPASTWHRCIYTWHSDFLSSLLHYNGISKAGTHVWTGTPLICPLVAGITQIASAPIQPGRSVATPTAHLVLLLACLETLAVTLQCRSSIRLPVSSYSLI